MSAVNFENGRRAVPMSAISSGEEGRLNNSYAVTLEEGEGMSTFYKRDQSERYRKEEA